MFSYEKGLGIRCVVPHTIQTGIGANPVMTSYHPDMADEHANDLKWSAGNSSVEIRFQGQLEDGRPALDEVLADGASVPLA